METAEKQEKTPMWAAPQEEHEWLHKLIGEWTYEGEAATESGENCKSVGTESVRSLGGLWVVGEGRGEMPGGAPAISIMTLGYDPQKGRFVGTWVGSMMTNLWVYDGELDAEGRVLTLNCEGPSMTGDGKMARYQDIIEFKSDDHRTLTARVQNNDGTWNQFMTTHYYRKSG